MTDKQPKLEVWCQIYVGREKKGGIVEVRGDFEDIADLRDAIKEQCRRTLAHCDAIELCVFHAGTKVEEVVDKNGKPLFDRAIDPGDAVPNDSKATLIVVSPPKHQYEANYDVNNAAYSREATLTDRHDEKNPQKVWYQLYIGREKKGTISKIVQNLRNISHLRKAVKETRRNALRNWDAPELYVFPAGTKVEEVVDEQGNLRPGSEGRSIDPGDAVPNDSEATLVVVAPPKHQHEAFDDVNNAAYSREATLTDRHDEKNPQKVWYQLYIGREKKGTIDRSVQNLRNISHLKKAVKETRRNALRNWDAPELYVFPAGTKVEEVVDEQGNLRPGSEGRSIDPGDAVPNDSEATLVVVAPPHH